MKYKAGDKVRVKSWEKMEEEFGLDEDGDINCYPCFMREMKIYCGKELTIRGAFLFYYQMIEDGKDWHWSDYMLEDAESSNNDDSQLGVHLENAVKYIRRASKKDNDKAKEYIKKAIWYLERFLEKEVE